MAQWKASDGSIHSNKDDADARSDITGSHAIGGGGSSVNAFGVGVATAGVKLMAFLLAGMALIIIIADNIKWMLILGGVYLAGLLVRSALRKIGFPLILRFLFGLATWVVFFGAVIGCIYSSRMRPVPVIASAPVVNSDAIVFSKLPFIAGLLTPNIRKSDTQRNVFEESGKIDSILEKGTPVKILNITNGRHLLIIEGTDSEGKTVQKYIYADYVSHLITPYKLEFTARVLNAVISNKPFFLMPGTYISDAGHELTINDVKYERAQPPVEIDGIVYYYNMILSAEEPSQGLKEIAGKYLITSNTSFKGPDGAVWTQIEEKR
jgi:hypothetical protein